MQHYTYGNIEDAEPYAGEDGSRVISFFIFNTDVHLHAYPSGREAAGSDAPGARGVAGAADVAAAGGDMAAAGGGVATPGAGTVAGGDMSAGGDMCAGGDASNPTERAADLDAALLACRDRCRYFELRLSRTREDSDVSRAHAASPRPVEVAPETAELVDVARAYCAASRGCFDITMGTVTRLWDFHEGVVPSSLELARALPHVGVENIEVGRAGEVPTLAITDPACVLDLGGVAKGYIADDLAGLLERHGVGRFVINLGGNVVVRGGRPGDGASRPPVRAGDPWKIGVVNPRDPAHYRAIVDIADGSVVTSGLHERRFSRGGRTYHHILSPQDGMPARTDVASATIIASRSLDCDGYSTTALMLGMDEGFAFAEELEGVEAVLIGEDDEVLWTSGIAERLSLVPTLPRW